MFIVEFSEDDRKSVAISHRLAELHEQTIKRVERARAISKAKQDDADHKLASSMEDEAPTESEDGTKPAPKPKTKAARKKRTTGERHCSSCGGTGHNIRTCGKTEDEEEEEQEEEEEEEEEKKPAKKKKTGKTTKTGKKEVIDLTDDRIARLISAAINPVMQMFTEVMKEKKKEEPKEEPKQKPKQEPEKPKRPTGAMREKWDKMKKRLEEQHKLKEENEKLKQQLAELQAKKNE